MERIANIIQKETAALKSRDFRAMVKSSVKSGTIARHIKSANDNKKIFHSRQVTAAEIVPQLEEITIYNFSKGFNGIVEHGACIVR